MKSQKNIGKLDRIIRVIVGLILVSLIFIGPKTVWGLVGLIPITTAIFGHCPPYAWLGINTNSKTMGKENT